MFGLVVVTAGGPSVLLFVIENVSKQKPVTRQIRCTVNEIFKGTKILLYVAKNCVVVDWFLTLIVSVIDNQPSSEW